MLSMYHILNRKTSKKCKKFYFFVYFLYKNAFFPYFLVLFLSTKYLNRHLKYHQGACFYMLHFIYFATTASKVMFCPSMVSVVPDVQTSDVSSAKTC